ncbi:MAG TPA: inositol monophosphatase family protein [Candidatus Binatia bacterium]|nr:inositol monophosphatase family protein [Candidatus Binatia bacterium]
MTTDRVPDRITLAIELARHAGAFIAAGLGRKRAVEFKSDVNLVTEIDRGAQAIIVDGLARVFPGDVVVAEEDVGQCASDGPCWYVDPLDGTTNFVHGLPHFAVSIAYFERGAAKAAVVYDPCKDELFTAERGHGAFCNGRPLAVSQVDMLDRALLVTGFPYDRREHIDAYLQYLRLFILRAQDVRRYGSASLDLCYVAGGRFDGFWEWKLQPWDTAAGWLVVEEAGGKVTDFDGSPYDPWAPRILATNGRIHAQALESLQVLAAQTTELTGTGSAR